MANRAKHKQGLPSWRRGRNIAWIALGAAVVAALSIGVAVFDGRSDQDATANAAAGPIERDPGGRSVPIVDVYKSPTCGCCSKWVEHLRDHGFPVRITDTTDVAAVKTRHGVLRQLESCHTALVDGYVVEGHVPAADVQRLLKERPAIAGLAVPGMPTGSPGMEVAGVKAQRYEVLGFAKDGSTRVFATHN